MGVLQSIYLASNSRVVTDYTTKNGSPKFVQFSNDQVKEIGSHIIPMISIPFGAARWIAAETSCVAL
jgi:hypothetical protein